MNVLYRLGDRNGVANRIVTYQNSYRVFLNDFNSIISNHYAPGASPIGELVSEEEYFYACTISSSRSFGQSGFTVDSPLYYHNSSINF
jgi:hypothetical protein